MGAAVLPGDCLAVLPTMQPASVDSVVTDPPYELGFMGKSWDRTGAAFRPETWAAVLRVLKPGGHLVAFGAPRNYHRLACAIEDAGFEVRDSLMWLTGQGFPKSLNVSRALGDAVCRCTPSLNYLPRMRDAEDDPGGVEEAQQGGVLQSLLPGEDSDGTDPHDPFSQGEGGLDGRQSGLLPDQDDRREKPGMEGRSYLSSAEGELRQREVRPLPSGPDPDGPGGRLHDGASPDNGEASGAPAASNGSSASSGSRPAEQRPRQPASLAGQPEPQTGGAWPVCERCGKQVVPDGLGTSLKPAYEPIILARKPLIGTVVENVQAHGTGALNIDGCRVETTDSGNRAGGRRPSTHEGYQRPNATMFQDKTDWAMPALGRWPANVVHDGSDEVLDLFPETGPSKAAHRGLAGRHDPGQGAGHNRIKAYTNTVRGHDDAGGSAARFFYSPKASKAERAGSKHPTVKPIALMRWLVRLVTPPGGVVLDPFAGTGTTGQAAIEEGFSVILIEREAEYIGDIERRLSERAA